ncbi:hypothetical protein LV78_005402 [Actinosynnema pretiosum]|nr:hypothetical protein [Actinosynnema pretiosum]
MSARLSGLPRPSTVDRSLAPVRGEDFPTAARSALTTAGPHEGPRGRSPFLRPANGDDLALFRLPVVTGGTCRG